MIVRSLAESRRRTVAARRFVSAGVSLLLLAGLGFAAQGQDRPRAGGSRPAQAARPARPAAAATDDPVVARVDGKAIRRLELEQRKERAMAGYREETGRDVPPAYATFFLRAALEEAVRERLIAAEARARGMRVSDAAAESVLREDAMFRPGGRFDRARFEAYRRENPKSFAQVREEARDFLLFQRRARELERALLPDEATLERLVAMRTEKARVQWALVSETQFDGRNDPDDEQIRATYARHRTSFVPPGRVSFTTLTVPGLEEGRVTAGGLARARERAGELLAELAAGAALDSLARRPGLVLGRDSWGQGQEAGLFAGQPQWAESAFASPPGRVLPRVFETPDGMALVRVDQATPRVAPPLALVADDVRARWRAETVAARDRAEARRFYDAHPDSFRTPSWVARWATIERARVPVEEPDESALRAWFEQHRSTFTRLDPAGGGVRLLTFEEARAEARERYLEEHRAAAARALADRVAGDWARGRSGPGRSTGLVTGGPATLVPGGEPPAGLRADLADTVRSWNEGPRAIVVPDPAGFAVVGLVRRAERERPPFEAVEAQALAAVARARLAEERVAARAWYEANRARYETGPGYAVVYAESPWPAPARVDVPARAIEREYRDNLAAWTPPLEVRVRHILFSTAARSVADATTLARNARGRIARGEDFAVVARELSEDPASRPQGGDLGFIRAGQTVPEFEKAAFALREDAPVSPPVQTSFGVHLIQLVERRGGRPEPFEAVRARITSKLVTQYSDTLSRERAEELFARATGRASLVAEAEAMRLPTAFTRWFEGSPLTGPAVLDVLRADAAAAAPGAMLPRVYRYLEQGYVVAALDSILPSRTLTFEEAESRVLADFRREGRLGAARARAARVEQELAQGRPWSEATETVGGTPEPVLVGYGDALPGFGQLPALDSLLFGPGAIPPGGHGRIETPRGTLIVSLVERVPADGEARARVRENVRRAVLNRRVWEHVEELRARARVEVLRQDLTERPPAPPRV